MGFNFSGHRRSTGYYLYFQLSEEEKKEMIDNIKQTGKKMYDNYLPGYLKNKFSPAQ